MVSVGTVISYPIPLYQNYPINSQFYLPNRFVISDIALGQTTIVTTTEDMNFSIGQLVRLIIPASFGSYQLNGQQGYVIEIPASNEVTITIDSSRNVNAYIASSSTVELAQIIAVGDVNNGQTNSSGLVNQIPYINGSFRNISPL